MQKSDLQKSNLPDLPGVYLFKQGRKVLYVGKATSLRDRVRSYFDDDLIATRGPRIVDMITRATSVMYHATPTVLEALVREAALIRKYLPSANVDGKDDKTFLYAVITDEEIPRVLAIRGKDINFDSQTILQNTGYSGTRFDLVAKQTSQGVALRNIYGPFPSGPQLRAGLRLIRRIFPFYDTEKPVGVKNKHQTANVEFNTQIEKFPRKFDAREYRKTIRHVSLFLGGQVKELRELLQREMKTAAADERFEGAARARRELFALDHIQDVSLIKDESRYPNYVPVGTKRGYRVEAYDTAHLSGTNAIGVMVVLIDGVPSKRDYRTFKIRGVKKNDDIASLREIISRRFNHQEWQFPNAIVVDGGKTHKKAAEALLKELNLEIPVAAVVKDERHRPREVLSARAAGISEADAVLANSEAHRFSLSRHRLARSRPLRN